MNDWDPNKLLNVSSHNMANLLLDNELSIEIELENEKDVLSQEKVLDEET